MMSYPAKIRTPTRFTIDIEATNRCNARCAFCPRDRTPHQGLMTADVFAQVRRRAIEFREQARREFADVEVTVTFCGLGEPLLNRCTPAFVRAIGDAGFRCQMSTNASLLDEATGSALLDAGLRGVFINAGDLDATYETVYGLSFERTRDNISRFAAMALGRCGVVLVIVGHDNDPERVDAVTRYWRERGIQQIQYHDLFNRGGSLNVEHMHFAQHRYVPVARELLRDGGVEPICAAPFRFLFVGYDGQYYLCSMDWEKQVPLGSVFDESFSSVMQQKLRHVATREPICASCSHEPLNTLAERLRTTASRGDTAPHEHDSLLAHIAADSGAARTVAAAFAK
jgi:MoaA/NifB/PqqE/SkfB family radical SAM enzyme